MSRVISIIGGMFAVAIVLSATTVQAVVLDNYSSDTTEGLYTTVAWYNAQASFTTAGGKLAPVADAPSASGFYWTNGVDGERFTPGETISIDVAPASSGDSSDGVAGLLLSTSTAYSHLMGIRNNGSDIAPDWVTYFDAIQISLAGTMPTDQTMSRLTLTRDLATPTNINWQLTQLNGLGLTGSGVFTFLDVGDAPLYFGPGVYRSAGAESAGMFDNLTHGAVPEPSTFLLLGVGLAGLLAYAWRKRK